VDVCGLIRDGRFNFALLWYPNIVPHRQLTIQKINPKLLNLKRLFLFAICGKRSHLSRNDRHFGGVIERPCTSVHWPEVLNIRKSNDDAGHQAVLITQTLETFEKSGFVGRFLVADFVLLAEKGEELCDLV